MYSKEERDEFAQSLLKAEWVLNILGPQCNQPSIVEMARALLDSNRILLEAISEDCDPPQEAGDIDTEWRDLNAA